MSLYLYSRAEGNKLSDEEAESSDDRPWRSSFSVNSVDCRVTYITLPYATSPLFSLTTVVSIMTPSIAETTDEYYHVRFADPDEFDQIRTPDWAENAASSVVDGAEVRTGHEEGGDDSDWEVQSVLVPIEKVSDEDDAVEQATRIVEKIES